MSTESNKSLVRRYIERVVNRGDMAVADELLAPSYKRYVSPMGAAVTADVQKRRLGDVRAAFSDWHLTVEDMIAEGDRVAFRATIHATHEGTFQGLAPTGKPISVSVLEILRVENDKLVEHWGGADVQSLLWQLGAVASMGGKRMGAQVAIPGILTAELVRHGNANCINDCGQVVGESDIGGHTYRAFVWRDGTPTELGPRLVGKEGDVTEGYPTNIKDIKMSFAEAINDCGQIVGHIVNAMDKHRAFLLQESGVTDLGTLGGKSSLAFGINNCGQIVGVSTTKEAVPQAFIWHSNAGMMPLGTLLGMKSSTALAINNAGEVVGCCGTTNETHGPDDRAFLWRNGEMVALGTLGGKMSRALAISDRGQIVGESDIANGQTHAFFWQAGMAHLTDLGTLGGAFSRATGINDRGEVVGQSRSEKQTLPEYPNLDTSPFFAVYWPEPEPGPVKLGQAGTKANAINNCGRVVGRIEHEIVNGQDWDGRALLWTTSSVIWI